MFGLDIAGDHLLSTEDILQAVVQGQLPVMAQSTDGYLPVDQNIGDLSSLVPTMDQPATPTEAGLIPGDIVGSIKALMQNPNWPIYAIVGIGLIVAARRGPKDIVRKPRRKKKGIRRTR